MLGSSGALPGRRKGPKENGTGGNQTRPFGHDSILRIWSTRVRLETWCRRRDSILLLPHNRDASEHVRLDIVDVGGTVSPPQRSDTGMNVLPSYSKRPLTGIQRKSESENKVDTAMMVSIQILAPSFSIAVNSIVV
jgi:hypothetical protein